MTNTTNLPANILASTSVFADQFWLIQVLQNVLDNAIHFADSMIEIYLHSTAQTVTIDIFNDGKQLPDYAIEKAFERYFSLSHQSQPAHQVTSQNAAYTTDTVYQNNESIPSDTPDASLKKGTGLGLTLVKQVIEHHGGKVTINNAQTHQKINANKIKHSGVMVSITLPLAQKHN